MSYLPLSIQLFCLTLLETVLAQVEYGHILLNAYPLLDKCFKHIDYLLIFHAWQNLSISNVVGYFIVALFQNWNKNRYTIVKIGF